MKQRRSIRLPQNVLSTNDKMPRHEVCEEWDEARVKCLTMQTESLQHSERIAAKGSR
jgi:hypothetical protein